MSETSAARVRNTEVSVIGIRYTSGRRGNLSVEHDEVAFSDLSVALR